MIVAVNTYVKFQIHYFRDSGVKYLLFILYPCIQDTLSSRAALGRVRRASKGILHSNCTSVYSVMFGF